MKPHIRLIKELVYPPYDCIMYEHYGCETTYNNQCYIERFYEIIQRDDRLYLAQITDTVEPKRWLKVFVDMKRKNIIVVLPFEHLKNTGININREKVELITKYLSLTHHKIKWLKIIDDNGLTEELLEKEYHYEPLDIGIKSTDEIIIFNTKKGLNRCLNSSFKNYVFTQQACEEEIKEYHRRVGY